MLLMMSNVKASKTIKTTSTDNSHLKNKLNAAYFINTCLFCIAMQSCKYVNCVHKNVPMHITIYNVP